MPRVCTATCGAYISHKAPSQGHEPGKELPDQALTRSLLPPGGDRRRPARRSHSHPAHGESSCGLNAPWSLSSSAGHFLFRQGRDFPWSSCSRAFCWLPVEQPDQSVHAPLCLLDLLLDRLSRQVCCSQANHRPAPTTVRNIRLSVSFWATAGVSRLPSWCLGLQHGHGPQHPCRLRSVSLKRDRV